MIIENTANGIYKMLDLSEVPLKIYRGREVFNWRECKDVKVPFMYGKESGTLFLSCGGRDSNGRQLLKLSFQERTVVKKAGEITSAVQIGGLFFSKIPVHLHQYIVNNADKQLPGGSNKKIECRCPNCGSVKQVKIHTLVRQGLNCSTCRSGASFPERVVKEILAQNSVDFIEQYEFPDLPRRYFDFYLPKLKTCVEVHGAQHYEPRFGEKAFTAVRNSDKEKEGYCRTNKIRFVEIDASKNTLLEIVQNIEKSSLSLKPKDKRLLIVNSQTQKTAPRNSKIKLLYEDGWSVLQLSEEFSMSRQGIVKILKKLGIRTTTKKKIVNIEQKILFESLTEAANYSGIKGISRLVQCCRGRANSAGKHPATRERLTWMYYEDYVEKYGTEGLTEYVGDKRELL